MNNEVDNHESSVEDSRNEETKKGWRKVLEVVWRWMSYKDKDEWLKEMRGNLSLISTVISTMTFQMALNPPGGIRPIKDGGDKDDVLTCTIIKDKTVIFAPESLELCPGEAVIGATDPETYAQFIICNTVCFVASLSVSFLLVSGIPLNHRFPMWVLSIGMCLTLTSLAATYITALLMVTPSPVWGQEEEFRKLFIVTIRIWIGMLLFLAFFLTLRITIWVVRFFAKKGKKAIPPNIPSDKTLPS